MISPEGQTPSSVSERGATGVGVSSGTGTERPPYLAHHFDTPRRQYESAKTGMWLFLATEILLFSGLFCAYAVYRANHPEVFLYAHRFLDKTLGGINTLILILSSLTAAWAVRAAQRNQRRLLVGLLLATLTCACAFLGIKAVEYNQKWKHGLLWGREYRPKVEAAQEAEAPVPKPPAPGRSSTSPGAVVSPLEVRSNIPEAAEGPPGLAREGPASGGEGAGRAGKGEPAPVERIPAGGPQNVQVFFSVYFLMTGLHGLHVIAGMVLFVWILRRAIRGDFSDRYFTPVDLGALYWHLVDVIWIYLFPLLYLIH
jgi:cytochrome c oxidase subunit 3